MKKRIILIIAVQLLTINFSLLTISAQSPQKLSYQAVVRDWENKLVLNKPVDIRISILQGTADGESVYVETQRPKTNSNGMLAIEIGSGETNDDFSAIDWSKGPYFIQSETDPYGRRRYQIKGTSQLLSVPYAIYAQTADSLSGGELDPIYSSSVASGITQADTSNWNNRLVTENDPLFSASIAEGITQEDTSNWNKKLEIEADPLFSSSVAGGITESDTSNWNKKLAIEADPIFNSSVAKAITQTDTAYWNNKSDFDGDFASLFNAPNIANTTNEKTIQLNTNDATSSLNIMKNNGTSVFKVDGTGRMSGDGSGLSNVKPLIKTIGGDQRYQITANYGSYNNVRTVTLTVPSSGTCFAMASGYLDWESTGWDLFLAAILCDNDPNSSWPAENEWYSYLNIVTDYNCPDSSDQYTSFAQHRCFNVSAGTHTFTLWANKYSSVSKTEVGDVNLSVMFFPTGGTGPSATSGTVLMNSSDNKAVLTKTSSEIVPGSVDGSTLPDNNMLKEHNVTLKEKIATLEQNNVTLEERVKNLENMLEKVLEEKQK